jgi:transcriptional regulator with XRE-family HTH domain
MAGAPRIEIDDDILKKTEALAAQGLSQDQIASVLGFSTDTLQRRKKDNAKFAAALKRGQHKGIAKVANALFTSATGGNLGAQVFYLKNRDRDNWKDKIDNTHTGPDDGPIVTRVERVIVNATNTDS